MYLRRRIARDLGHAWGSSCVREEEDSFETPIPDSERTASECYWLAMNYRDFLPFAATQSNYLERPRCVQELT